MIEVQDSSFIQFSALKQGETFVFNSNLHVKIEASGKLGDFNALRIGDDGHCRFHDLDKVRIVKNLIVEI